MPCCYRPHPMSFSMGMRLCLAVAVPIPTSPSDGKLQEQVESMRRDILRLEYQKNELDKVRPVSGGLDVLVRETTRGFSTCC